MKEQTVRSFSTLSSRDKISLAVKHKIGWRTTGTGPFWSSILSDRSTINHVAVYSHGDYLYDAVQRLWKPAVKVLPVRFSPDGVAEFFLIHEARVLSGSHQPQPSVVGGVLERGETYVQGALRELREETGFTPETLVYIGNMKAEAYSSPSRFPVFLALISNAHDTPHTSLDGGENIHGGAWYRYEEIFTQSIEDTHLLASLAYASRVLREDALR